MQSDFNKWLDELSEIADKQNIIIEAKYYDGLDFFFKSKFTPAQALPKYIDLALRVNAIKHGTEPIYDGVSLIKKERDRQIKQEKHEPDTDASIYHDNELADAAICYCVEPGLRDSSAFPWPWDEKHFKPTPEDRIRELSKAGALVAAQIDVEIRKKAIRENVGK